MKAISTKHFIFQIISVIDFPVKNTNSFIALCNHLNLFQGNKMSQGICNYDNLIKEIVRKEQVRKQSIILRFNVIVDYRIVKNEPNL
jgi:hypothetical protein